MSELAKPHQRGPAGESGSGRPIRVWAATMLALLAATAGGRLLPFLAPLVGALAVGAFLWVPARELEAQGRDLHDVGFRMDRPLDELAAGLAVCAIVLPPFAVAFAWFTGALPGLPTVLRGVLSPYSAPRHAFQGLAALWGDRLDLAGRIAGNGAVALAEELFYRCWLTAELEARWPPRFRLLGAPLGRAALLANGMFAVGHLLVFAPWRLLTFFPGLLFAWLRARTGTIAAPALCHWIFNVALLLLERLAFG